MVVPHAARIVAALVGVLLVGTSAWSVIGTLIVPRSVSSWLTKHVDQLVNFAFICATASVRTSGGRKYLRTRPGARYVTSPDDGTGKVPMHSPDEVAFHRRDRILAAQAATLLISQLAAWLCIFFVGFSLIFWPFVHGGITNAFAEAGPGLWQIGEDRARGGFEQAILDVATLTSVVTITLLIAYLPTLYTEFNRRENEVALLVARGGVPCWGPELLARTQYALGTGTSTINTLPDLFANWERWAAELAESHTTYLPLVRFRSPKPLSSWVTALLAVLDAAALMLALNPESAPTVAARLCLRAGFTCFGDIARAMGHDIPVEADPDGTISLTYDDFLAAIARLDEVGFQPERSPEEAWPDFVGWRLNYERAAYAIAWDVDAVPAYWSGPRRHKNTRPIPPRRPPTGRPPDGDGKKRVISI